MFFTSKHLGVHGRGAKVFNTVECFDPKPASLSFFCFCGGGGGDLSKCSLFVSSRARLSDALHVSKPKFNKEAGFLEG